MVTGVRYCPCREHAIFLTQKDGYDYLVVTSLWTGQGICYYDYNVLSPVDYSFDRYHNELKGAEHYDPQFFTGLENWLKEDSLLLVATDINMPQGQGSHSDDR